MSESPPPAPEAPIQKAQHNVESASHSMSTQPTHVDLQAPPFPHIYPPPPPPPSMSTVNDQYQSAQDMQRDPSASSVDSGYLTSAPHQPTDGDQRLPQDSAAYGPTRPYSAVKSSPKTFPRVRLTNPLPRPSNETRQACIPCRRKKVGCDLRQPGNDYEPPCKRCMAEGTRCVFTSGDAIANESGSQALPSLSQLACMHCSQVFLREDDLRLHLRTQCPEKHYACATCGSRFRRLNDLDRHTRIHTGERPHVCDLCKRTFSRATTLTRHRQGPQGCAGRRADLGRRRLGSFQGPPPDYAMEEGLSAQGQPLLS